MLQSSAERQREKKSVFSAGRRLTRCSCVCCGVLHNEEGEREDARGWAVGPQDARAGQRGRAVVRLPRPRAAHRAASQVPAQPVLAAQFRAGPSAGDAGRVDAGDARASRDDRARRRPAAAVPAAAVARRGMLQPRPVRGVPWPGLCCPPARSRHCPLTPPRASSAVRRAPPPPRAPLEEEPSSEVRGRVGAVADARLCSLTPARRLAGVPAAAPPPRAAVVAQQLGRGAERAMRRARAGGRGAPRAPCAARRLAVLRSLRPPARHAATPPNHAAAYGGRVAAGAAGGGWGRRCRAGGAQSELGDAGCERR